MHIPFLSWAALGMLRYWFPSPVAARLSRVTGEGGLSGRTLDYCGHVRSVRRLGVRQFGPVRGLQSLLPLYGSSSGLSHTCSLGCFVQEVTLVGSGERQPDVGMHMLVLLSYEILSTVHVLLKQ
jgi:hypothetical protein